MTNRLLACLVLAAAEACSSGSGHSSAESSTTGGTSASDTSSADSSSSDASTDASTDTSGATTSQTASSSSSGVSLLGGLWSVTTITCGGKAANAAVAALTNAPDGITFLFSGSSCTESRSYQGCTHAYTFATRVTGTTVGLTPNGSTCSPAHCAADCGTAAKSESYSYLVNGTLTLTSGTGTLDTTCTANGMTNPIVYTLGKPPPP